jgi:hypothetical protein
MTSLRLLRQTAVVGALIVLALAPSCAGKKGPLDEFSDRQRTKVVEASSYQQADFNFWAALYEPNEEDFEAMRTAWIAHGQAFPESKTFAGIEEEVRKRSQKVVIVSLFTSSYENANLRDQSFGWSVSPVPLKILEVSDNYDAAIRTVMPVKNIWARYFLLRYSPDVLATTDRIVIANRVGKVTLVRQR